VIGWSLLDAAREREGAIEANASVAGEAAAVAGAAPEPPPLRLIELVRPDRAEVVGRVGAEAAAADAEEKSPP